LTHHVAERAVRLDRVVAALRARARTPERTGNIPAPREVFPAWRRAQLEVERLAGGPLHPPGVLRTTGFLRPEAARRVADWFTGKPGAPARAVRRSYEALERDTARCRLRADLPPGELVADCRLRAMPRARSWR
jgi:hypothetical protein